MGVLSTVKYLHGRYFEIWWKYVRTAVFKRSLFSFLISVFLDRSRPDSYILEPDFVPNIRKNSKFPGGREQQFTSVLLKFQKIGNLKKEVLRIKRPLPLLYSIGSVHLVAFPAYTLDKTAERCTVFVACYLAI